MKRICLLITWLFLACNAASQCPTITVPSVLNLVNCQGGDTIAAVSSYSTNIVSRWIGPGNIQISSIGSSTSVARLNHFGTYTVEFTDQSSNCVVSKTVQVNTSSISPSFTVNLSSNTVCVGSAIVVNFNGIQSGSGGAVSMTLCPPGTGLPSFPWNANSQYTISTCGQYTAAISDWVTSCYVSYIFDITCSTLTAIPIIVTGSGTVCAGSSITFTANNGTNLAWNGNPSVNTNTFNTIPQSSTPCYVNGFDVNNCVTSGTCYAVVNSACSDVWPGDANSDGVVDNTDVFEIGLALNATGPMRPAASIAYTSQQTTNWTGTGSTGKNRCHVDGNGDGIINNLDQQAIANNYALTHPFKPSEENSNNPNIYMVASGIMATGGLWNKADIFLGDVQSPLASVYGVAFDLDFDHNYIETDSVKIVYSSSFLNASNQNIEFEKDSYVNNKIFAATVRTDGNNASGEGKVAEFYFKIKIGIPENAVLNLGISNAKMIDKLGSKNLLAGNTIQMLIDPNPDGINEKESARKTLIIYPNPAKTHITIAGKKEEMSYEIISLLGSKITNGTLTNSGLDVSNLENGVYFLKVIDKDENVISKRFVISR